MFKLIKMFCRKMNLLYNVFAFFECGDVIGLQGKFIAAVIVPIVLVVLFSLGRISDDVKSSDVDFGI
ncbi:hypothetical protein ACQ1PY_11025, partial [Ornithobacterium rhinotracheale]